MVSCALVQDHKYDHGANEAIRSAQSTSHVQIGLSAVVLVLLINHTFTVTGAGNVSYLTITAPVCQACLWTFALSMAESHLGHSDRTPCNVGMRAHTT